MPAAPSTGERICVYDTLSSAVFTAAWAARS
jgi:hypothetical protein